MVSASVYQIEDASSILAVCSHGVACGEVNRPVLDDGAIAAKVKK